jgi:hypothetical protein
MTPAAVRRSWARRRLGTIEIGLIFTALLSFLALLVFPGCAPERQTMPTIVVAPGLKERLAWMDRVRLHDEGRQSMMEAQGVVRDDDDFDFVGEEMPVAESQAAPTTQTQTQTQTPRIAPETAPQPQDAQPRFRVRVIK